MRKMFEALGTLVAALIVMVFGWATIVYDVRAYGWDGKLALGLLFVISLVELAGFVLAQRKR